MNVLACYTNEVHREISQSTIGCIKIEPEVVAYFSAERRDLDKVEAIILEVESLNGVADLLAWGYSDIIPVLVCALET